MVELDLRYQAMWTPWYDLAIIFKTIYVILGRAGAY
ncbi:sugar transferase [Argonema antarcticum A004/B2]|nr:sugar transferase [Argonema antarcticum A004/B2]